jgi:hypothetical protein
MPAQTVIKLRRDTAANWTSVNPVLAAGEAGLETDTGLLKYGNGTSAWAALSYPSNSNTTYLVRNNTGATIPKGTLVAATGAEPSGRIDVAPFEVTGLQDSELRVMGIATANIASGVNGTVMSFGTLTGLDTRGSTASALAVGDETWAAGDVLYAHPTVDGKLTNVRPKHDLAIAFVTVRNATAGQISIRIVPGNFHLEWMHDVALSSPSNGDVLQYNGTDWVNADVISQVTSAIVDSAPSTLDTLNELAAALGDDANFATTVTTALGNKQDKVTGVSDTEISYLDGVTSAIQTQLNGKAASSHTHAISDVTNLQTSLDAKANLAGPTFTGNVVLPGTTTIGNVSATELGFVDGVTSAIQTQLDGKAATSHTHNASAITYTIEDKSANYTIVAADEGKVIRSTGSAITVTVADVFSIGEVVTFTQYGAGQVTFAPAGGVTLHSVDSKRKTNKQYSTVQVMKTAAATYLLFGDIAA